MDDAASDNLQIDSEEYIVTADNPTNIDSKGTPATPDAFDLIKDMRIMDLLESIQRARKTKEMIDTLELNQAH